MTTINSYQNGNYTVTIHSDGTKVREYDGTPVPTFPESMDVKITNFCDAGCKYCHEKSTTEGKHGDILGAGLEVVSDLPRGTELAIGGGNPLDHPDLHHWLSNLHRYGLVPNMTVNALHLNSHATQLVNIVEQGLIYGLGLSYQPGFVDDLIDWSNWYEHTVVHMIMGVHTVQQLQELIDHPDRTRPLKVLLLGYKQFGRGKAFYQVRPEKVEVCLYEWVRKIHKFFKSGAVLSFDNLGIEQLDLKRFFSKEKWQQFYMGDDGKFTMYMDLVRQEFALSSTSADKKPIGDKDIVEMFKEIRDAT